MGRNARVHHPGKADVHEKHPVLGLERENSPSGHQLLTAGRIPVSRSAFGTVDFCSTVILRRAATGSHIEHAEKLADRTVAAKCSKNLTQPAHFFSPAHGSGRKRYFDTRANQSPILGESLPTSTYFATFKRT